MLNTVSFDQAASDVYAPVSGVVVDANTELADESNLNKVWLALARC